MQIQDIFNNREIAVAIWLLLFLVFILWKAETRKSVPDVLHAFCHAKILISMLCMIIYVSLLIVLLHYLHLWQTSLLKDTLLWFCFTGILMFVKFVTTKAGQYPFKKAMIDNFKLVIVLEFIVNTYTFSLGAELALVPLAILIAALITFAQYDQTSSMAIKPLTILQAILGMAILAYASYRAVLDFRNLGSYDTLKIFILPILLSLLFLPFVYIAVLYSVYEGVFIGLNMGHRKDSELIRYTKWTIFKHCHFRLRRISQLTPYDLSLIMNHNDVAELLSRTEIG